MSNPSRFDKRELLSGNGGLDFEKKCLAPAMNRHQCDIRLTEDKSELLPGTKAVLLLGQRAHTEWTGETTTLDEHRGSPILINGIPYISSFAPQDAADWMKDHESALNPLAKQAAVEFEGEEDVGGDEKRRGITARGNYAFWLKQDTKKILRLLANPALCAPHNETYRIYPSCDEVIRVLEGTYGQCLNLDIETDIDTLDMRCFGFSFSGNPKLTYVVPTLTIRYLPAYGMDNARIYRALYVAMQNNTVVAHNGAAFDLPVLAHKYRLPVKRAYDTLIAQHRLFPEVEKSLGHCISLHTYLPYHKDEGVHTYLTDQQADQLYKYCGKDVYGMHLVKEAIDAEAEKDPGLKASIALANRAIVPYMTMSLMGMRYDEVRLKEWIAESDLQAEQFMRVIQTLTGPKVPPLISNQKCVQYFHTMLGYPVVGRTKTNNASLSADLLLKLKQKVTDNPVIDFLIRYREKKKEVGTLNFKPWKINK